MVYNIYQNSIENLIKQINTEGCYANKEEVEQVLTEAMLIIRKNLDKTPEEIVDIMIQDNIRELENIRAHYPIPGYNVSVNFNNMHVKMIGGDIDSQKRKMPDNALFDIASMTKFYTQIIAYNLIREGVFSFDDKIKELAPFFENVGDLRVGDVLTFSVSFRTNERIDEVKYQSQALKLLYTMDVVKKNSYNYNDMGMMLMKEVMEHVTGKSYATLLKEYIVTPLELSDTHLSINGCHTSLEVPYEKFTRLTGSSNIDIGAVNDPSANALGGFSGHAGIFASNDDLVKLGYGVASLKLLNEKEYYQACIPGMKENRGFMGNTYVAHKEGINMSFVDKLESKTNFAIQGSTRVQTNIGRTCKGDVVTNTILLNPASMGITKAYSQELKINSELLSNNEPRQKLIRNYVFKRDGRYIRYNLIDARRMCPVDYTMCPITTSNAKLTLKLRLLHEFMKEYDKNYTKEVTLVKHI